jgi:hypothetical protein
VNLFFTGALTLANVVVAMFFHRFWRKTGDRFFGLFALAFVTFAGARIALSVVDAQHEGRDYLYLVRLVGFLIILVAILDKNRKTPATRT